MASTQKKSSSRSGSRGSSGGKKGGEKRAAASAPKKARSAPRTYWREAFAAVFLLLAFFALIGCFQTEAGAFIAFFSRWLKGICGYGFYAVPVVYLAAAWILAFHRGRPVRLRTVCAVLGPILLGALLHLFLSRGEYPLTAASCKALWLDGSGLLCGGVAGGFLAEFFRYAFGTFGAAALLILLMAVDVMCIFRLTPSAIVDFFRDKRAARPEPEEDDELEPLEPEKPEPKEKRETLRGDRQSRKAIDIPVDDGPEQPLPTVPVTTVRKKRLFDRSSTVARPDEVLTGQAPAIVPDKPAYEDVPEIAPIPEREHPTAPAAQPATPAQPEPAAAQSVPEPPPIIREPAVEKATSQETARAKEEITQQIEQTLEREPEAYRYPPLSLLKAGSSAAGGEAIGELHANQKRLEDTLQSFGVDARIVNVTRGPSVTRYELELEQGVKLNKITNLSDDIALALGAAAVRIAPIPDKISTVGIEVPNRSVTSVAIREVIGSEAFTGSKSKVSFAVGKDIAGSCIVGDIAKLPHMLIAGTTGSGKSVCTNSLIVSLLYKATPEEVRLIMVDPKMVELGVYNGIPHLLIPVVTDPKKAAGALQWAVNEMMRRYREFSEVGAKDLASYNNHARRDGKPTMAQIVVVIDELADLMLVAAKEVEESICRVAQMGRAAGMHLVIATQRPSADVITGLMKANIPSRIALAVASAMESRIILDTAGAEKLVGKGDMLYFPLGTGKPQRVQGCFISEEEVAAVVDFVKEGAAARYDEAVLHEIEQHAEEKDKGAKGVGGADPTAGDYDELLPAAIEVVLEVGQASVSMLQRRLKLGYGRAARLVDQMEEKGVVGPFEGSKPRQLLITKEQWQEMQFRQGLAPAPAAPNHQDAAGTDAYEPEEPDGWDEDEPPFREDD